MRLTYTQIRILGYIRDNPGITWSEFASKFGAEQIDTVSCLRD